MQGRGDPLTKGSEDMNEMATDEMLVRAILIDKCDDIEELRESVGRILKDKE